MGTSYLKALQLQKKLEEKAKKEAENRTVAEELLADVDGILDGYKKAGIDVSEAETERDKAKAIMDAKDYGDSLKVLESTKKKLEGAKEAALDTMLSSSEDMVLLSKTLGADAKKADELLGKAKKAMDEDDQLDVIVKYVREAWGEAEKILHERVSGTFSAAQSLLNRTKEIGKDTAAGETLYQEARESVDKGDYRSALDKLAECVDIVGARVKEYISAISDEVKGIIAVGEETGSDMSKAKEDLESIGKLIEDMEYEDALKLANLLRESAGNTISEGLNERVRAASENIRVGKEIDADLAKAEELLAAVKKNIQSNDYPKAEEELKTVEEEVANACFQSVLKVISNARGKFLTAKKIGADISKPLGLLNKARDAMKDGRFKEAISFAESSNKEIESLVSQYEEAQSHIEEVEENLSLAGELGIDTAFSEQLVEEARSALSESDFSKALDLINKSKEKVENAEYEKVMDALSDAESTLAL
ncbi:MAG: hypothetical protein KAT70_09485, partial [Thermoplasmata archaeon]|nr:hypothetical protein [Thermoplasmata archaeon]